MAKNDTQNKPKDDKRGAFAETEFKNIIFCSVTRTEPYFAKPFTY
jgi:hypothetical protein